MSKLGIVCEGGGTRGSYTAGVLSWFLDNQIPLDYINGISAGAYTASQYVSKQPDRLRSTSTTWLADKHYMGLRAILDEGAIVGINFVFDKLKELEPFDEETFYANPIHFEFGVFNLETGNVEYYGKESLKTNYELFKASCKLPILSRVARIDGKFYLDGGVKDMIPIYHANEIGVKYNFVVLTKPENYVRKPEKKWQMALIRLLYGRKFPKLIENLKRRHIEFKEEVEYIYEGEKNGNTLVLRPSKDLHIGRTTRDVDLLNQMFDLGYEDCEMRKEQIMALVNRAKSE